MKIAQIMAGAPHGGAELFFERLSIALAESGEDVLVLMRSDRDRARRFAAAGIAYEEFPFGAPFDFLTRPRLSRRLASFRPKVAISWMSRATRHTPRGDFVHVARLGGYYPLRYYRRCDHLVGNTHGLVQWFRANGWPPERTHWLPNFVADYGSVTPAEGLRGGLPLILGLGRLHRDKGFDVLLRALAKLPGARLAIAGEGPERDALVRLAAEEHVTERVMFLGWRSDAGALLKAAQLFVCPSRREPLGNVVLEAWSAGCPVLATDARGPRELVKDGVDGVLVSREDPERLAQAATALLAAPEHAHALAVAGRARFLAEFSKPRVITAWRRFLADVAR